MGALSAAIRMNTLSNFSFPIIFACLVLARGLFLAQGFKSNSRSNHEIGVLSAAIRMNILSNFSFPIIFACLVLTRGLFLAQGFKSNSRPLDVVLPSLQRQQVYHNSMMGHYYSSYVKAFLPALYRWMIPGSGLYLSNDDGELEVNGGSEPRDWANEEDKHESQVLVERMIAEQPIEVIDLKHEQHLRIFAISDLHSDYRQSLNWVKNWEDYRRPGSHTVLVVAGDLSGDPRVVGETFVALARAFDDVFFVAGNHDLWTHHAAGAGPGGGARCSLAKLAGLAAVARAAGVRTAPARYVNAKGGGGGGGVAVFPLLSWYHPSWDTEPPLPEDKLAIVYEGRPEFEKRWADFRNCKWPNTICTQDEFVSTDTKSTALADYFAYLNEPWLRQYESMLQEGTEAPASSLTEAYSHDEQQQNKQDYIISFSHFLPRIELCPEKRFLREPMITKVIGSDPLERQVRRLGSDMHIYGHLHIPMDIELGGVRYCHWPLGSAREQGRQCAPVLAAGPLAVYDTAAAAAGPLEVQATMWGDHYREHARDPSNAEIAPWVLRDVRGRLAQRRR